MSNEKLIQTLSDLIGVMTDRIDTYERRAGDLYIGEVMLRALCYQLAEESLEFKRELTERMESMGAEVRKEAGKVYGEWVKTNGVEVDHSTTLGILTSIELMEDKVQKVYKMALEDRDLLPYAIVQLLEDQKTLLRMSHDLIRNQRDEHRGDSPNTETK